MSEYSLKSGIYKITNPKGKIYIGRSVNIKKRWGEHKNKTNSLIYRSIQKYGYENHIFEVIIHTILDHELLNKLEEFYIKFYDSTNPKIGLNLCKGGGRFGFKHTDATIEKMKRNRKGWKNSIGRVLSEETKLKISNSLKGNKLSSETIQKVSETRMDKGMSLSYFDNELGIFYYSQRELRDNLNLNYYKLKELLQLDNCRYQLLQ